MNSFEKILLSLDSYRNTISGIGDRYKKESESNSKFYGSSVYNDIQNDTKKLYKSEFDKAREQERRDIDDMFQSVYTSLESYVCRPVRDQQLLNTITSAHSLGITFSAAELQYFNNSIGNTYLGNKIVTALAKESGVSTITLEKNNLDTLSRSVKNGESSVRNFINFFSGNNLQAYDLLDPEQINNPLGSTLSAAASDSEVFKAGSPILQCALIFSENDVPATINSRTLTSTDKQIIDFMFQDCESQEEKKNRATTLISENSDLKPIFDLDPDIRPLINSKDK